MEASERLWGVKRFDLMQIHNMLDWETHLETLKQWKAEGRVRYIGITTSHGRRHDELERALQRERFDFVQFTYNVVDREVEQRLLPLAAERGTAVIVNRPFRRGALFDRVRGRPLPDWAREFDCSNWAQFFLKFAVSHPNVTCAIPATSRADHMIENMGAAYGRLPDVATRRRMGVYFEAL
jgi:aryl-alcohol dehydrogenase-like predicted oxidoreductase